MEATEGDDFEYEYIVAVRYVVDRAIPILSDRPMDKKDLMAIAREVVEVEEDGSVSCFEVLAYSPVAGIDAG